MNHPTFSALPVQTQSALASISAAVEGVLPIEVRSWRIDVSELPAESDGSTLIQDVAAWAGKSKACLYYFECHSPDIDLGKIECAFADAKGHEANDRAYPRLNTKGKVFYVGSSQSVAKRLRNTGVGVRSCLLPSQPRLGKRQDLTPKAALQVHAQ